MTCNFELPRRTLFYRHSTLAKITLQALYCKQKIYTLGPVVNTNQDIFSQILFESFSPVNTKTPERWIYDHQSLTGHALYDMTFSFSKTSSTRKARSWFWRTFLKDAFSVTVWRVGQIVEEIPRFQTKRGACGRCFIIYYATPHPCLHFIPLSDEANNYKNKISEYWTSITISVI